MDQGDPKRFDEVLIHVATADGREIGWGETLSERLGDRKEDIKAGVEAAAQILENSIAALPSPTDWRADEVSASFGLTLTAGAGVLISKVEAGATFEVTIKFTRDKHP